MGLENQVALVTGAASDIGYAYVKCLLLNKVKVGKTKIDKLYIAQFFILTILFHILQITIYNIEFRCYSAMLMSTNAKL